MNVLLFLATGFEEIEALATVDILRRAGINVQMVSVTGEYTVTGSHAINVETDFLIEDADFDSASMLILPGGLPGSTNLAAHELLCQRIQEHVASNRPVSAICAAPLVLGRLGLLAGHRATCYPGVEGELAGATYTSAMVEQDGLFITGKGPAAAFDFAYTIVERLLDKATADGIRAGMLWST